MMVSDCCAPETLPHLALETVADARVAQVWEVAKALSSW
jgi:hypothetical protein